jgi:F420-non-reducing hydrogenase small subunit
MKTKISTEWLSGCSGCHVAIVDLHEKLLPLLDSIEFVRIPVLMDEKNYPDADIGIVEGAIRSEHDREALLKLRKSVKTLIAFGTCAVYGGPSGLGWLCSPDSVLRCAYSQGPTNAPQQMPDQGAPKLEQSVTPIDEVVNVDIAVPGCPPNPFWIATLLNAVGSSNMAALTQKTVCSRCDRTMKKTTGQTLKKGAVTAPEKDMCFLSQGVVCMGSVTLERCLAQCPNHGVACGGCAGPSADIITEPHIDIRTMLTKRMHLLTQIEKNKIQEYLESQAKTYYAYSLASPVIYKKPTVEIREWTGAASS